MTQATLSPMMRKIGYHKLLDKQADRVNPKCMICGVPESETSKRLSVDHCHTEGTFRGLLCTSCNAGLGMFKDDPALLVKAAQYLTEHRQVPEVTPLPPPQPAKRWSRGIPQVYKAAGLRFHLPQ